jgi:hypothetical protein
MTPQVTNRREGGLTSCRGRLWKLHTFTEKEQETLQVAQKLLEGVRRLLAGGVPGQGDGGGGN